MFNPPPAHGNPDSPDSNRLRATLRKQGTISVITGRYNRKQPIRHDERRYKDRLRFEATFCRFKNLRHGAARNYISALVLATSVAF